MNINTNHYELYLDNYNICNLIKLINKNYRLVFDKVKKCFLILNIANNNEICLKFKSFSANIIKILQKSRIENSTKIFKDIDDYNAKLEQNNTLKIKSKVNDSIANLINYSKRTNSISKTDIYKIIEGQNG